MHALFTCRYEVINICFVYTQVRSAAADGHAARVSAHFRRRISADGACFSAPFLDGMRVDALIT